MCVCVCLHVYWQTIGHCFSIWQRNQQPVYQITPEVCVIFKIEVTSQICLFEGPFSNFYLLYALSLTRWNHIQQYKNILSILQVSMFRSAERPLYQITAETWTPFQTVSFNPHSAEHVKYLHCHSVIVPKPQQWKSIKIKYWINL